jgi:hypothetical protein
MEDAAHLTFEFMRRSFGVASGDFGWHLDVLELHHLGPASLMNTDSLGHGARTLLSALGGLASCAAELWG